MPIRKIDQYHRELERVADLSDVATFYHSRLWLESLAATFPRMSFRCLVSYAGKYPSGFLPYFIVRRGPFRSVWSLPFGTYGGPAALDGTVASALIDEFSRVVSSPGVVEAGWVDFGNAAHETAGTGWSRHELHTHLINISGGFDTLWRETFEQQRRKRTRRAERLGVTVRRTSSRQDLTSYYQIYSSRIDQWGSGIQYPESLFARLLETGGDAVRLYVAEHDGAIVGGHFNFYFKDTVTAWMGVTTRESSTLQAGTLLYVQCLRDACSEGYRIYNLGGSLNKQSLIDFKESLGGEPYEYCQYRRRSILARAAALFKRTGG
jgi:CelD/BcsL family acetyltransferase involved in cellulose biosynthesis